MKNKLSIISIVFVLILIVLVINLFLSNQKKEEEIVNLKSYILSAAYNEHYENAIKHIEDIEKMNEVNNNLETSLMLVSSELKAANILFESLDDGNHVFSSLIKKYWDFLRISANHVEEWDEIERGNELKKIEQVSNNIKFLYENMDFSILTTGTSQEKNEYWINLYKKMEYDHILEVHFRHWADESF
ncbi:hypothetical protein ACLIA0_15160 [Bacillaceae bacterium W0354]